jgi:hypothetical protein
LREASADKSVADAAVVVVPWEKLSKSDVFAAGDKVVRLAELEEKLSGTPHDAVAAWRRANEWLAKALDAIGEEDREAYRIEGNLKSTQAALKRLGGAH